MIVKDILVKYCFLVGILFVMTSFLNGCYANNKPKYQVSFFEDKASVHSLETIKGEHFTKTKHHIINLGITKSTLWLKIKLDTLQKENSVVQINRALLDSVTVFYQTGISKITSETLGVMIPQSKNKFNHFVPAFEIPTTNLITPDIYIQIKSRWSMQVPVKVYTKSKFQATRIYTYIVAGLLFGGLLIMVIYNLFLFLSTKDISYLIYVGAIFCTVLSQGYIEGFLIQFLSPEIPKFSFCFPVVIMGVTTSFSALFSISFLEIKQYGKKMYYILIGAICLALFSALFEFVGDSHVSRKLNILQVIIGAVITLASGVYAVVKKNQIARYFTLAWSVYLSGIVVFALKTIDVLPHNSFTNHFMHIGTFCEAILLSFALGHKYNVVRREKEKLEAQTREELEELVKVQTYELKKSLEEKEVLLKEVHHRVKNNLQIVISLLDLQVASVKNEKNKEVLAQSKSRVYSMSLIHQKLYQSDNLARVCTKGYLEELFHYVKSTYQIQEQVLEYNLDIEKIELSLIKAVPLGLIVNELLTNSFKYGIVKEQNFIEVLLNKKENDIYLSISDSGEGFEQPKKKVGVKSSLGLFLTESLTKQLKGTITRTIEEERFVTTLVFPME